MDYLVEELGIVAIARGSKNVVSDDVSNGAPGKNVDDVEPNRVVGLEKADILLGPGVSGLVVCLAILLRHLLGYILSLEVEEHEPS